MISSIEIKNFKSIKSKLFALRNLNVLLGLNGQGKSSFTQSLLLLRQSQRHITEHINLNDEKLIRIGKAKDALYQYAKEDMSFEVKFSESKILNLVFEYKSDSDIMKVKDSSKSLNIPMDEALFTKNFQYLNAERVEPKSLHSKSYSSITIDRNIGKKGEYTVHFLEVNGDENIAFENCIHPDTIISVNNKNERFKDKRLIHQVNLWLSEISPEVQIKTTDLTSDFVQLAFEYKQPTFGETNAFKPENVGFGISYVLHVVTALLKAKSGDLLIIENPESHIHPRGQAELGKLIALVAQNDVQIIIETHSDHIVNGIRVGIKEEKLSKDKARLFYFKKIVEEQEQYSAITDIVLDKNGTLSEEPEGLLDEWGNQLLKLF
ncbi:AAA family ATPase [Sinomicrobium soli]|uniref:AAA family ATPase n=1 Tax=Sinomicrobium sp. N-1-3-6 TaxID=2219864 RepID=UPI000DCB819A|nr:DUF3696 domain-containing protein [Sinomicrobium sp. N-1-3-6]RAV28056.1 DUF3696 domain-containing protein [Sinomicrobium sp. N-1-3-6]